VQYWTSRGFGVLDLNYRGSTGYGRAYREALYGHWGEADVADCVAAARALGGGLIDPARCAITGSSAGGYTVLCSLGWGEGVFCAGASYYGISDLELLARDTHKFESLYLEHLIGPYPQMREVYRARSPIHRLSHWRSPVIFMQGLEDKVVPPNQSLRMVRALRRQGLTVSCLRFAHEGHGFRSASSISRALRAELRFYGQIMDFDAQL
jgi:dipeptidyl aminopeptidase/acylaminoacyl peptidase